MKIGSSHSHITRTLPTHFSLNVSGIHSSILPSHCTLYPSNTSTKAIPQKTLWLSYWGGFKGHNCADICLGEKGKGRANTTIFSTCAFPAGWSYSCGKQTACTGPGLSNVSLPCIALNVVDPQPWD